MQDYEENFQQIQQQKERELVEQLQFLQKKGASSVTIGCYVAVLHALNYMDKDLLLVAKDDELGRKLQDLDLPVRKRVSRK